MGAAARLRVLLLSPSNQAAAFYGFTGVGFAGSNLILAKTLPILEYATLSLIVSIFFLAVPLAPLGANGVINRHLLRPGRPLLLRGVATSVLVTALTLAASAALYDLRGATLALLAPGLVAGGITMVTAACYQRLQRFLPALLLEQAANVLLIGAALWTLVPALRSLWLPLWVIVVGHAVAAAWSWRDLLGSSDVEAAGAEKVGFPWRESLYFAGVSGSSLLLIQLERLLLPRVLSLEELARFSVLAAVTLAPYRMLQMGFSFSLLPRMRAVESVRGRRRLLARESVSLVLLLGVGSVLVLWLAPPLLDWLFAEQFRFERSLILAAVFAGVTRAVAGLAGGVATALCSARQLAVLNVSVWLSVGVAVVGGGLGARWGLAGVIYGVAAGWITLSASYAIAAAPHLRRSVLASRERPPGPTSEDSGAENP